MAELPKVAIVGAGSTGIAIGKALGDRRIPWVCFEKSDRVGGNWVFRNKNGLSSAYRSLHINTSRDRMAYADLPMPRSYPDFPHHSLIARYFEEYVERFDLRSKIRFETSVERITKERGLFRIELEGGEVEWFDAVVVANGHHWDPRWPDPPFPGRFDGVELHSHHYIDPSEPHDLIGKRVVVVGMGNSAMDIACELSRAGIAEKVFLAVRRGAWIIPNYLFGRPLDQALPLPPWLPFKVRQAFGATMHRLAVGSMERYGLPRPDHPIGSAHPTISSEILPKLGRGDIVIKPNLAAKEGRTLRFTDGSTEEVDAIVYCTGYKVTFPFFDPTWIAAPGNDLPLFHRVFHPEEPGLAFAGLLQPLGAIMPLAEAQGRWLASYFTGEYALPPRPEMLSAIARDRQAMFARYVPSARHTMQVDFDDYLRAVEKERRRGEGRAQRLGRTLPIAPRAAVVTS
jgi:cation diffusion facilitator CzcD-associated flavoprotein CzcO